MRQCSTYFQIGFHNANGMQEQGYMAVGYLSVGSWREGRRHKTQVFC